MDRLTVGGAVLDRIEETVDTSFTAEGFFPAFDPEVLRPHMSWLAPRYYIAERGALVGLPCWRKRLPPRRPVGS